MDTHPDFAAMPTPERGFNHRPLPGGRVLIGPRKDKWTWQPEERRYRSAIVCPLAGIVSQGFPKFDNYLESEADTARLRAALAAGEQVWFTEKMDGSLAIRSVIDGRVVFRTRGTADGGDHGAPMRAIAAARYPVLLDPAFEPGRSLLFEFVSPDFPIVIPYEEDDLILLGAADHADGRLAGRDELASLAERHALSLVESHVLPTDPDELREAVAAFSDREGVVARCDDDQVLVKLKSASYLAAHALRFAFTPRRVAEFCAERGIDDEEAFIAAIRAEGVDWEVGEETRGSFRAYRGAVSAAEARFDELSALCDGWRDLPRREFAEHAKAYRAEAKILFMCLDGRIERARQAIIDDHVEEAVRAQSARVPATAGAPEAG